MKEAPVSEALERSLKELTLKPQDAATVELARTCANLVDFDEKQAMYAGGLLLKALVELRMTPKARTEVTKGKADVDGASERARLRDELRERRSRHRGNAS